MDQIARTPIQLGAILRRRRKGLSLSQTDLGQRISLRQPSISALEAAETDARLSTLMDVLAALDLELVVRPRTRGDDIDIETMF